MNPQCLCSDAKPEGASDESQCTYECAGDSSIKMCGGLGYINIFHTDAHSTTIDDWGCGNTAQDTYYQKWYTDMSHCTEGTKGTTKITTSGTTPKTTSTTTLPITTPGSLVEIFC